MRNAGLVAGDEATLVSLGDVTAAPAVLAVAGLVLIAALEARRVTGGPLIGILAVTAIGLALGVTPFRGVVDVPPSIAPTHIPSSARWRASARSNAGLAIMIRKRKKPIQRARLSSSICAWARPNARSK